MELTGALAFLPSSHWRLVSGIITAAEVSTIASCQVAALVCSLCLRAFPGGARASSGWWLAANVHEACGHPKLCIIVPMSWIRPVRGMFL